MNDLRNYIDELHSRTDIVSVISRYVKLKKSGVNYVGLCPFHHEKTPSFVVSPSKQLFHCFGCGASGDIVKFMMMIENIEFKDAVSTLAKEAGMEPPKFEKGKETSKEKETIKNVNRFAFNYFRSLLNEKILVYLKKRGLKDTSIEKYGIGYSGNSFEEMVTLGEKNGFSLDTFIKAGILKRNENGEVRPYFLNRIMIPIFDSAGDVIAFSGRAIDNAEPKYLNSPETSIFSKSRTLYFMNFSKNSIRETKEAIIVEGYFDAMVLSQEGIENVVSSMGTSFTEEQARLIKRFADKIYFFYDNDKGGRLGAERAIEVCGGLDLGIGIVTSKENMDPDEIVLTEGREGIDELLRNAKDPLFFIADFESRMVEDTPQGKAELSRKMLDVVSKISNRVTVYEYLRRLSVYLGLDLAFLIDQYNKILSSPKMINKEPLDIKTDQFTALQELLTQAILQRKESVPLIIEAINIKDDFVEPYRKICLRALLDIDSGKDPDPKSWYDLEEDELSLCFSLTLKDSFLVRDEAITKAIESFKTLKLYKDHVVKLFKELSTAKDEEERIVKLKEYDETLRKLKGR